MRCMETWSPVDEFGELLMRRKRAPVAESFVLIGDGPAARLRKLLDGFAYRDLSSLSGPDRDRNCRYLFQLVGAASQRKIAMFPRLPENEPASAKHVSLETLRLAQRAVRAVVETLAQGRMYGHEWRRVHISGLWLSEGKGLAVTFDASLADALVYAALLLVGEIGSSRLRLCPYRRVRSARECGRAFVAVKRQKWCPGHKAVARQERDRRAQAVHREKIKKGTARRAVRPRTKMNDEGGMLPKRLRAR